MTDSPNPVRQPVRSRQMTRDQAAMLVVTISVCTILGAMGFLSIMVLPGETAESAPEPPPVSPTESGSDEPEPALEYSTTEDFAPDSLEGVAARWMEASINNDVPAIESLTCANPTTAVTESLEYAATQEVTDLDYIDPGVYVTTREHDGYHEVATFLIADEPTYDYVWEKEHRPGDVIIIMTVIEEGGEWKVCGYEGF
ncbi:hypothetical protein [Glycomyces rhizosphaerae]|uniref:DUF4829 domain-containing protein n=1 Tax=Glycomyces rhizosphaerae TaxID=2054422 RepID=A0ABV7Q026_9ACTN